MFALFPVSPLEDKVGHGTLLLYQVASSLLVIDSFLGDDNADVNTRYLVHVLRR